MKFDKIGTMKNLAQLFSTCILIGATLMNFFVHTAMAQQCGTKIPDEHVAYVIEQRAAAASQRGGRPDPTDPPDPPELDTNRKLIPVKAHIIRDASGFTSLAVSDIEDALETVNQIYSPINMVFFLCGDVNFIDNDDWYAWVEAGSTEETTITNNNNVQNVLNIYFTSGLIDADGNWLRGFSNMMLPPLFTQKDWIFMANPYVGNGSTLPHEIGHYFNLFHTHDTVFGLENVERVSVQPCYNCLSTGDLLCDTPADPELDCGTTASANVSVTSPGICSFSGPPLTDGCGEFYTPPIENIMSYGCSECRYELTFMQLYKVQETYFNIRNYLDVSNCPTIPCETEFLVLTAPVTADEVFEVNDYILGYNVINSGVEADYDAGNFIQLKPGFVTQPGSHFKAYIEGCTPDNSKARVKEETENEVHEFFALEEPGFSHSRSRAFPNPFSENCTIAYQVADPGSMVRIAIFDLSGVEVRSLVNAKHAAGQHQVVFETQNMQPGFYFYVFDTGGFSETKKLVMSR